MLLFEIELIDIWFIPNNFSTTFFSVGFVLIWPEESHTTFLALPNLHVQMPPHMIISITFGYEFQITECALKSFDPFVNFEVMGKAALILKYLTTIFVVTLVA